MLQNDFSFVQGLTKVGKDVTSYGELSSVVQIQDNLKQEYCLESFIALEHLEGSPIQIVVITVPKHYSDIKLEWILECYVYYIPAVVEVIIKREGE